MTDVSHVPEMEKLFMALADRTRLRLLNLMAGDGVCVNHFTEILGESQPKVSRHLAYLRNSGLVDTRRNGKWIYYSIRWPADRAAASVLDATLSALSSDAVMRSDARRLSDLVAIRRVAEETFASPVTDVPEYETPSRVRPVHNELDEFLL